MSGVDHKELTEYVQSLKREADGEMRSRVRGILKATLWRILARTQTKYLIGGQPLHSRSNRLRSSVRVSELREQDRVLSGKVGTNVFYGRVWEYGASTPGHIVKPVNINPRTGKVFSRLRFRLGPYGAHGEAGGSWVSPKQVRLLPKPWLRPAVDDIVPNMKAEIMKTMMKALKGGGGK